MERPERINIRVRKELREGFKELFKKDKFVDIFEQLIFDYLEEEIRRKKAFAAATSATLNSCAPADIDVFTVQDEQARNEVVKLLEIKKKAFPTGKPENSQISSRLHDGNNYCCK